MSCPQQGARGGAGILRGGARCTPMRRSRGYVLGSVARQSRLKKACFGNSSAIECVGELQTSHAVSVQMFSSPHQLSRYPPACLHTLLWVPARIPQWGSPIIAGSCCWLCHVPGAAEGYTARSSSPQAMAIAASFSASSDEVPFGFKRYRMRRLWSCSRESGDHEEDQRGLVA
jgi:hypothetical protein